MVLHPNNQLLVDALSNLLLLDDRYEKITLVNVNAVTGEKRGCFSLVFKAFDVVEGKHVALKFFDLNPAVRVLRYRLEAFEREHALLQNLIGRRRCLQLKSELKIYDLLVPTSSGIFTVGCQYFAVAWLDEELDTFFHRQDSYSAVEKLHLFNELVMAVEALHVADVFHRDLKPDNIRAYEDALKRVVVAIDLGTAALASSTQIRPDYDHPAGALSHSAPEAAFGFAGDRLIAPYTDIYALGCLLFELFNRNLFFLEFQNRNPGIGYQLTAAHSVLTSAMSAEDKRKAWQAEIKKLAAGVVSVDMLSAGNSVPTEVAGLLNEILSAMTNINFGCRKVSLKWVRGRVWLIIRLLENKEILRRKEVYSKLMMERRRASRLRKAVRLQAHMAKNKLC